jgi:hypothetical protein
MDGDGVLGDSEIRGGFLVCEAGLAMLGEVRWCVRSDSGYNAGIKQVQNLP